MSVAIFSQTKYNSLEGKSGGNELFSIYKKKKSLLPCPELTYCTIFMPYTSGCVNIFKTHYSTLERLHFLNLVYVFFN